MTWTLSIHLKPFWKDEWNGSNNFQVFSYLYLAYDLTLICWCFAAAVNLLSCINRNLCRIMLQWNLSPFLSCFQVKVNHKPINFWCLTNQQEFLQLCFLKIQKKSQGLFKNFVQKSVHKVCMYIQLFIHKFTISRLRVLTMVLNLDFTIYFKTHNIIVVSYAHRHLRIIKGLLIKQSAAFNRPEMLNWILHFKQSSAFPKKARKAFSNYIPPSSTRFFHLLWNDLHFKSFKKHFIESETSLLKLGLAHSYVLCPSRKQRE